MGHSPIRKNVGIYTMLKHKCLHTQIPSPVNGTEASIIGCFFSDIHGVKGSVMIADDLSTLSVCGCVFEFCTATKSASTFSIGKTDLYQISRVCHTDCKAQLTGQTISIFGEGSVDIISLARCGDSESKNPQAGVFLSGESSDISYFNTSKCSVRGINVALDGFSNSGNFSHIICTDSSALRNAISFCGMSADNLKKKIVTNLVLSNNSFGPANLETRYCEYLMKNVVIRESKAQSYVFFIDKQDLLAFAFLDCSVDVPQDKLYNGNFEGIKVIDTTGSNFDVHDAPLSFPTTLKCSFAICMTNVIKTKTNLLRILFLIHGIIY